MHELVVAATLLLTLFSFAPYIPSGIFVVDMPSHFVLQYAIGAVVLIAGALIFKAPSYIHVCLALSLCLNLWQLKPLYSADNAIATGKPLKVLQVNTLFLNTHTDALKNLIAAETPDIVLASEVTAAFEQMFQSLSAAYPHQFLMSKDDMAYGLAVLSKSPLLKSETTYFDHPEIAAHIVRIHHDGKDIDIVSVHPANPVGSIDSRNNEFTEIAKWFAQNKPTNAILAGDFNATPYCHAFKKLEKGSGLAHARLGRGAQGSWPSWLPPFMRIPIDHVLVSENIVVTDYRMAPDIGSDHLPTIATVALK